MKLGWVLGHRHHHDDVTRLMRTTVNHEITEREPHNGYTSPIQAADQAFLTDVQHAGMAQVVPWGYIVRLLIALRFNH